MSQSHRAGWTSVVVNKTYLKVALMRIAFVCKTVDLIRKYFPVVKKTCKKTLDIKSDVLQSEGPGFGRVRKTIKRYWR